MRAKKERKAENCDKLPRGYVGISMGIMAKDIIQSNTNKYQMIACGPDWVGVGKLSEREKNSARLARRGDEPPLPRPLSGRSARLACRCVEFTVDSFFALKLNQGPFIS